MPEQLTLEKLRVNDRLVEVEKHMAGSSVLMNEVKASLIKLEGKVGMQNGRIGKLELWRAGIIGGFGTILFMLGKIWH